MMAKISSRWAAVKRERRALLGMGARALFLLSSKLDMLLSKLDMLLSKLDMLPMLASDPEKLRPTPEDRLGLLPRGPSP